MSMRIEKVIKLEKSFAHDVHNIYQNAERFQWKDSQIIEAIRVNIYENPEYKKMPRYAKSFVQGVIFYLREMHWRKVVFSYEINGKRLATNSPEYRKVSPKYVHETCSQSGCFIYAEPPNKLFTEPENERGN